MTRIVVVLDGKLHPKTKRRYQLHDSPENIVKSAFLDEHTFNEDLEVITLAIQNKYSLKHEDGIVGPQTRGTILDIGRLRNAKSKLLDQVEIFLSGGVSEKDLRISLAKLLTINNLKNWSKENGYEGAFKKKNLSFFQYVSKIIKEIKEDKNSQQDSAMMASSSALFKDPTTGGIDFKDTDSIINTRGDEIDFAMPANITAESLMNSEGLMPVVIDIIPVTNFYNLLGLNGEEREEFEAMKDEFADDELSLNEYKCASFNKHC